MKKLTTLFLLLLSVAIITSCGSDDEDPAGGDPTGGDGDGFTYDGTFYDLSFAFIEDYGDNGNGSFDVDITLTNQNVNTSADSFTGINFIYLDLNTATEGVLEARTYVWDADRGVGTMVDAEMGAGVTISSEGEISAGDFFTASSGTVTVTQSGSNYTIAFTISGSGGSASGTYTGTLTDLD